MRIKNKLFTSAILSLLSLTACKEKADQVDAQMLGPAAAAVGTIIGVGHYTFIDELDETYTTSCGTATVVSAAGGGNDTAQSYNITAFYTFKRKIFDVIANNSSTILMKYTYYPDRDTFNLNPTTSVTLTCNTFDYQKCDATGTFQCETADNITCGGTKAFIFHDNIQNVNFQAESGTIDWSAGFALNETNTAVTLADLDIFMQDGTGSYFSGKFRCEQN